jgi:sugar lactone lactonase YvrE
MAWRFPVLIVAVFTAAVAILSPGPRSAIADTRMYVSSFNSNSIFAVDENGTYTAFATGTFDGPAGMVRDAAGNFYVNNRGLATTFNGSTISKVSPGGTISPFASGGGMNTPIGSAMDSLGNIYVANYSAGTISKVTPAGTVSTFVSGLSTPHGLTIDASDNLYVAQYTAGVVRKITPAATTSIYANISGWAMDSVFDSLGNLFVVSQSGSSALISKVAPGGGVSTFLTIPNSTPQALAYDQGFLYMTDAIGAGSIWKIAPDTTRTVFTSGFIGRSMILVPEPASLGIAACAAGLLLRRRRSQQP